MISVVTMLRNLIEVGRQAYSCTCLMPSMCNWTQRVAFHAAPLLLDVNTHMENAVTAMKNEGADKEDMESFEKGLAGLTM